MNSEHYSAVSLTEKLRKCEPFFPKVSQLIMVDIIGPNYNHKEKSQEKSLVIFAQNGAKLHARAFHSL